MGCIIRLKMNQTNLKILWENYGGKKKLYTLMTNNKEIQHRYWNPFISKLAASLFNGMEIFPFNLNSKILFSEKFASSTLIHLTDIVDSEKMIFTMKHDVKNNNFENKKFDVIYFDMMNNENIYNQILNYERTLKPSGFLIFIITFSNMEQEILSKQSLSDWWKSKTFEEKLNFFDNMGIPLTHEKKLKVKSSKFSEFSQSWQNNITLVKNSTKNDFSFKNQIDKILNNTESSFQFIQEINLSDFFKNCMLIIIQKNN